MDEFDNQIAEYREDGFNEDQINEIREGLLKGLDVSIYDKGEFMAIQMYHIRMGLEEGLDVSKYADPIFDWFQMEEIRLGLEKNLDVSIYAKPEIGYETMREVRKGLEEDFRLDKYLRFDPGILREMRRANRDKVNIIPYIKMGYVPEQLEEIRYALKKKCNIDPYLNEGFRGVSIHQITLGLEKGLDVSYYSKPEYDWRQMEEIRLGLEHRVDASRYAKKLINWKQMREIRLGLEEGLDVSLYESLCYSDREMCRIRTGLLENHYDDPLHEDTDATADYGVTPAEMEQIEVTFSEDSMKAYIHIPIDVPIPTAEGIMAILRMRGVVYGYLWDTIALIQTGYMPEKVMIAEGKEPIDGKDGYYEYLPYGNYGKKSVNVRKRKSRYKTVVKEQAVVKYHPAIPQVHGRTVRGLTVKGKPGKEQEALSGCGFRLDKDRYTYLADITGVINFDEAEKKLKIVPLLVVESMNSINSSISYDGTVHVMGTMEGNAFLEATGDVFVDDFVGSATIISGGDVFLNKGMSGSGIGRIKAAGDIEARFFENSTLEAGGSIRANYFLNCNTISGDKVVAIGKNGYIGGGIAKAKNLIMVENLGNRMNINTLVSVGSVEHVLEKLDRLHNVKKSLEKQLKILKNALEDYNLKYSPEFRNAIPMFIQIEDAVYTQEKKVKDITVEMAMLNQELSDLKEAGLYVEGTVYEGTIIEINGVKYPSKQLSKVEFSNKDGSVVYHSID